MLKRSVSRAPSAEVRKGRESSRAHGKCPLHFHHKSHMQNRKHLYCPSGAQAIHVMKASRASRASAASSRFFPDGADFPDL